MQAVARSAEESGAANVVASGLAFPEGPAFAPDGALWCVELKGGTLVRLADGSMRRFDVGGAPNGLTFDHLGRAVFCDAAAGAVRRLDPGDGTVETLASSSADLMLDGPNDLAFDAAGRLVFTCPGNSRTEPTGTVWSRAADGRLAAIAQGLYFPNGLAFSADGRVLFIAETYRKRVWRGDYDLASGAWLNAAPWVEFGDTGTGPDGLAIAENGDLLAAIFGQGRVCRIDATGTIVQSCPLTGSRPTNCCFDPGGQLGLVVTEAERGEVLSLPATGLGINLFDGHHAR